MGSSLDLGWVEKDIEANIQTCEVGARLKALIEGVFTAPFDSMHTQSNSMSSPSKRAHVNVLGNITRVGF